MINRKEMKKAIDRLGMTGKLLLSINDTGRFKDYEI